jgi:peroxiredoxin
VRSLALLVVLAACRPEPVPLNPHKHQGRGGRPEISRDPTQNVAPGGVVMTREGTQLEIENLWKDNRVVLVFYKGHWCPHCQHQLAELEKYRPEITGMKATVAAISTDTTEDAKALREQLHLGFELYSDTALQVISRFGVEDYGTQVSLPATFVIEKGGAISYRKVGRESATEHPSIDELMAALNQPVPVD